MAQRIRPSVTNKTTHDGIRLSKNFSNSVNSSLKKKNFFSDSLHNVISATQSICFALNASLCGYVATILPSSSALSDGVTELRSLLAFSFEPNKLDIASDWPRGNPMKMTTLSIEELTSNDLSARMQILS
ncbi:hypothetical protein ACFE04_011151 [Oxalis oulophora]